jgi:hypothetical protein
MLGNLLQRKELRTAKPRLFDAGATHPQRLDDMAEGIERHTHV